MTGSRGYSGAIGTVTTAKFVWAANWKPSARTELLPGAAFSGTVTVMLALPVLDMVAVPTSTQVEPTNQRTTRTSPAPKPRRETPVSSPATPVVTLIRGATSKGTSTVSEPAAKRTAWPAPPGVAGRVKVPLAAPVASVWKVPSSIAELAGRWSVSVTVAVAGKCSTL